MAAGNSLLIWNKKLRWNRTASDFKQKLSLCMFSEYDNYDRLIHCCLSQYTVVFSDYLE